MTNIYKYIIVCLASILISVSYSNAQYQMSVYAVTSTRASQSGEEPSKCIDGDLTTMYHNNWNQVGIPDTLTFYFNATVSSINSIDYVPRQSGYNGIWNKVDIYYSTQSSPTTFTKINSATLNWSSNAQTKSYTFPSAIQQPFAIRFVVSAAYGNFSSCAEMRFYSSAQQTTAASDCLDQYNLGSDITSANIQSYSYLFTDSTFTTLKSGVDQSTIDAISNAFVKTLAQCIYNGTYQTKYRLRQYEAFNMVSTVSSSLRFSSYDAYENPTGIIFVPNQKVVLFVSGIASNKSARLIVKNFANESTMTEKSYTLGNGVNIVNVSDSGLGYISYYVGQDVASMKVNIAGGSINGVYDLRYNQPNDWMEMISLNTYPKIDIYGKYVHLNYDKAALKNYNPLSPLKIIGIYDSIQQSELALSGLIKYNKVPKNHIFTYSQSTGGWFAGGLGAHFDLTWGQANSCDPVNLDLWGIAHEIGHVNQIRPNLRWTGTTEVTNNIYSAWADYNFNRNGQKYARLERESVTNNQNNNSTVGGRYINYMDSVIVLGKNINVLSDPFMKLVPFWQLECYYQLAGAAKGAPQLLIDGTTSDASYIGIDYAHWYANVAEVSRNTNNYGLSNKNYILNFVVNTCDAVQEDLTDFFIRSGFLKPVNQIIDDYTPANITITQSEVDDIVATVKAKNYTAPVSPVIYYINALNQHIFRDKKTLSGITGEGYDIVTASGLNYLSIHSDQWPNAVAYESYNKTNLMHVYLLGAGDITAATTRVELGGDVDSVYAVGYDGAKIRVYPTTTLPIKFTAVKADNKSKIPLINQVSWNVSTEENMQHYIIDRSIDGKNFDSIGVLPAQGITLYQYTDTASIVNADALKKVYYRIRGISFDGHTDISSIATVILHEHITNISVYPNPARNNIQVTLPETGDYQLYIYSTDGKIQLQKTIINASNIDINISSLPQGSYLLKVLNRNHVTGIFKIIKL